MVKEELYVGVTILKFFIYMPLSINITKLNNLFIQYYYFSAYEIFNFFFILGLS
jgi:hypothetical protein